MPSFQSLALFFTVGLATFTYAAPLLGAVTGTLDGVVGGLVDTGAKSVPDIINELTANLQPLTASLNALNADNATQAAIEPVVKNIEGLLNVAISEVNALVDSPLDTVLALAGSVLSITELASTVGALLNLLFSSIGFTLAVVNSVDLDNVQPLLAGVSILAGDLVAAIVGLPVVGGLAGTLINAVLPIVGGVLPVIGSLGVNNLLSILGQL